jgi:hypothetical protein
MQSKPGLERYERATLKEPPFLLNAARRGIVLDVVLNQCAFDRWILHAAHVRMNHFHVVVTAECAPERVLGRIKAYASRALNEQFGRRDGSTVWLWDGRNVDDAVDYVVKRQGEPMAVYENPARWAEYSAQPTSPGK